jgi:hypothetical protein
MRYDDDKDTLYERMVAVVDDWFGPHEMSFTIRSYLVPALLAEVDRPLDLGRFGGALEAPSGR